MKILVDLQGMQIQNTIPEIGEYVKNFAKELIKHAGNHEILIFLNGSFPETISAIKNEFCDLIAAKNIFIWQSAKNIGEKSQVIERDFQRFSEISREAFIACLKPDLVLITSLFEGFEDSAVTSIGGFSSFLTAVILYDLPFSIDQVQLLENENMKQWYFQKMDHLQRANLILSSSTASINEAMNYFDISTDKIIHADIRENFSLEKTAQFIIQAFEKLYSKTNIANTNNLNAFQRKKLAYVSVLPPVASGVADYSGSLIPALSKYYDIDIISSQSKFSDARISSICQIVNVDDFLNTSHKYDRILYHMGNSDLYEYAFNLIEKVPGVIVLHDFYISNAKLALAEIKNNFIVENLDKDFKLDLYHSHGYTALVESFGKTREQIVYKYPINFKILQAALGVLIHSDYSRNLGKIWYDSLIINDWIKIPFIRDKVHKKSRSCAKKELGIKEDDFLICSFGIMHLTKLNIELIIAFLNSSLTEEKNVRLMFIGENNDEPYIKEIEYLLKNTELTNKVKMIGRVSSQDYKLYLEAADMAVQLRTLSRGETSAGLFDCLNYGIPTIVNANGAFAEIPVDTVYMLPDKFKSYELTSALEYVWSNKLLRDSLSKNSSDLVSTSNTPAICAAKYFASIEHFYHENQLIRCKIFQNAREIFSKDKTQFLPEIIDNIEINFPIKRLKKQLFIDVSAITRVPLNSGIQRVVKKIIQQLILNPFKEYRIEPIYSEHGKYFYARKFTAELVGIPSDFLDNKEQIKISMEDIFLGLDLDLEYIPKNKQFFSLLQNLGAKIYFIVYDLLPLHYPQYFPDYFYSYFKNWFDTIFQFDGVICISKAVADDFVEWKSANKADSSCKVSWFHLGADFYKQENIDIQYDKKMMLILNILKQSKAFLMVGTIEPRKGYLQTLKAFEILWKLGFNVTLTIVGAIGWGGVDEFLEKLKTHKKLNKKLFWFDKPDDNLLNYFYEVHDCLIMASEAEGFGLPLIEAARKKLPIIARDIPVFREILGCHTLYFQGKEPEDLKYIIEKWLSLDLSASELDISKVTVLNWEQSCENLIKVLNEFHNPLVIN